MMRAFDYFIVTLVGLALAYAVATTVASAVSASISHSADLIAHPERAAQ